jgi:YVTN family beta-propeller protein
MSRPFPTPLTLLGLGLGIVCVGASTLAGCAQATADECVVDRFEAQPTQRFLAGQTFYLPVLADSSVCADVRWTVAERPEASEDPIVRGNDGIWRITPTVPGRYRFALAEVDGGETLELEVVPADAQPFYNLNYYPAHAAERVGDELWVANVQAPTITRFDPSNLAVLGEIPVGPWPVSLAWREGMDFAVVAQRGNDTLGLVELASGRLVDAIWVGDEPAHVVLSPDGATAYVALKSEDAVAVVDLRARVRTARIAVGSDPLAMALSSDGATLWVASHRSGHPNRFPFPDDPVADERDVAVIDTASGEVVDWWLDVGTTLTSLLYREDTDEVYLARLVNDTEANLADPDEPNFMYEVAVFDAATGEERRSVDVGRQPSAGGLAVSLHGLTLAGDRLWLTAEASDLALALDPDSLAELARIDAPGRPRSVVADPESGAVYVHGSQATALTKIEGLAAVSTAMTTADPRPETVAAGQAYFTGAGRDYAQNWSCNACHVDGLSDTLVWNAGPFAGRKVSRPFFWLEGTYPLGWDGYLSSVDNYAFTVNTNVGVRPTTEEHRNLSAYLSSMMPPPAQNGYTRRDGTLSELGARGKDIYEGKAGCISCHPLPLTTNRAVLGIGVTEGTTDVPGLIGTYRLGVWLKRGEATTLHSAVDQVFASLGDPQLSDDERAALDQFLLELTARDFFVLSSEPRAGEQAIAVDEAITVIFSHPLFDAPANLARVTLVDADGEPVEVDRALSEDGRHLTLTPSAALDHGRDYTVVVAPELESFASGTLWSPDPASPSPWEIALRTAAAPSLALEGEYLWVVDMPTADLEALEFNRETTITTSVSLSVDATAAGGQVTLDYGQDLALARAFVVDGQTLRSPALPIPIGPSFADSTGIAATLVDLDGDGIGDYAEGTVTISGPGFLEPGVAWRLVRPSAPGTCEEGSAGALALDLQFGPDGPIVDWGSDQPDGLGVYFIGPDAQPPAGPGQPVTGGEVFWALQLANFPDGFAGPVSYGTVPDGAIDDTQNVGGGDGPAALQSGDCVKVAVTTTGFMQGSITFVVP